MRLDYGLVSKSGVRWHQFSNGLPHARFPPIVPVLGAFDCDVLAAGQASAEDAVVDAYGAIENRRELAGRPGVRLTRTPVLSILGSVVEDQIGPVAITKFERRIAQDSEVVAKLEDQLGVGFFQWTPIEMQMSLAEEPHHANQGRVLEDLGTRHNDPVPQPVDFPLLWVECDQIAGVEFAESVTQLGQHHREDLEIVSIEGDRGERPSWHRLGGSKGNYVHIRETTSSYRGFRA